MVVVIAICCNKYVQNTICPNSALYGQTYFGMKLEKNVIKGKSTQMAGFFHRHCRYHIVIANKD